MAPSLPGSIGKYTIERFMESGGMGDVYLARDPSLDRPVAIKFLREGFDNEEMRERFEREARAAGRLSHPNIVTIYEFGEFERRPFIAMEFVRGEPLSKLIRRREPMSIVRKLELMEGLCSGLGHAHKAGIVHRDIKPANLMVDVDGPLKILDFGIVRMAGSGLTSHGVLVGTVNYMSPEQIAGSAAIDHRSDVFAVGAVLHEIFTYQRAFPGEMADVLYRIVHTRPESAAAIVPGLDPGIVRAIDQCLDKAPERRYQDLSVLRRELARIRQRLEVEEGDTHGPTAATARPVADAPGSHASRPSGQAPPSVPPSAPPSAPARTPPPAPPAPGTSPSERARRADDAAAAERARAQQAEEARLAREREEAEQARLAHEAAERERIMQQQRDDRARLERERAERQRAEQARAEQARAEQAGLEASRAEQVRLDKARAEEAERARVDRERTEQGRLEEARKARAEADRKRAEDQQRAREEAARLAEARRLQKRRDLAEAKRLVDAGHFADAVQLLRPWAPESGTDATYNGVLREAESGVAQIEGQRRAQEAIAHHVAAAAEMLLRQDLTGASRAVQAILKAHPTHAGAQNLEREIVRAVEVRGRAASVVERARAMFDAQPGDALALLERFTPPHGLVDSTLAELRQTFATREQARQRQERDERRRAAVARVTGQAGALAQSRIVQGAAALLVLVVAVVAWRGLSPNPPPVVPTLPVTGGTVTPGTGDLTPANPSKPAEPDRPVVDVPVRPNKPIGTSANKGQIATPPDGGRDKPGPADTSGRDRITPPNPNGGRADGGRPKTDPVKEGTNAGNATPGPGDRPPPGGNNTVPDRGTPKEPEPTAKDPDPKPDPVVTRPKNDPPPVDPVAVARTEIQGWIASYKAAYRALDADRVRTMNRGATLKPAMLVSASVDFSKVRIDVFPDGESAALVATVRYENVGKRTGKEPSSPFLINWRMRKINGFWVANP